MNTTIENLRSASAAIEQDLEELLFDHSIIYEWNIPDENIVVLSPSGNFAYRPLGTEGRRLQSRILRQYRQYFELLKVLLQGGAEDDRRLLEDTNVTLMHIIEQEHTWSSTTVEEFTRVSQAFNMQSQLLDHLYSAKEGECLIVPDTNALIYNPALEAWTFEQPDSFTIVLLPVVLQELDSLKSPSRNESVRKKAERLIRTVKEYRRRGSLLDGVTIRQNTITLRAIAGEPDPNSYLTWFDPARADDRLLASTISIMREHPRAQVLIVTRDINLQNKAEYACIPYIEPPEAKPDVAGEE